MCGIFGVKGFGGDRLEVARVALHTLTHRGPDQWGEHVADGVYLGHRRLSIRDLSEAGRQPFVDAASGVAVIVNGEIWNDAALRRELGEARFRGHSDCEVFLHGYLTWGLAGLLERLDGFFAAAIHDPRSDTLHLVKDRFGKKPLYYAHHEGTWVFASEAKAILSYLPACRVFDLSAIQHWLCYRGSLQADTIFKGINRVPQGAALSLSSDGRCQQLRYFQFEKMVHSAYPAAVTSEEALDAQVESLLGAAIGKRFLSDVPVGIQLSGGVDSSLVAVLAKEQQGKALDAYTVVFPDAADRDFDESAGARQVAQYCGFRHHELPVNNASISEAFADVVWLFDGMLDIPNAIPIYLLAKAAKKDVSVLLTGEGADELFGGYNKFTWAPRLAARQPGWARFVPHGFFEKLPLPLAVQHRVRSLYLNKNYAGQPDRLLRDLNSFISHESVARLLGARWRDPLQGMDMDALHALPFAKQLQVVDQLTYLNFLLERQDKASMGMAMEARLPFLDYDLVKAISPLPSHCLFDHKMLKKPLKRMLARRLGDEFAYRTKCGFSLPIASWLHDSKGLGRYVEQALSADFMLWNYFDRDRFLAYIGGQTFSLRQLSYSDDEAIWFRWFLAVLAVAQERFAIASAE
ncbi:MAG: asparagine synthase (glutamine-hydrolyzing) [Dechloromonas sp.]|nr:asparagine synthase (glutamine-hydrolyzing) [Dechloromonas sp.]